MGTRKPKFIKYSGDQRSVIAGDSPFHDFLALDCPSDILLPYLGDANHSLTERQDARVLARISSFGVATSELHARLT